MTYATGKVTSRDGTQIGYRRLGAGPGLILVHGGMQASQNLMKLAAALADAFTLYVLDRRGRGLSGPHGDYSLAREGEDLQALVRETGTRNVFGLSSGAIVTLQTALIEPSLERIALYEPPLPVDPTHAYTGWVERYERELAAGKPGSALVSIARGTGDTSPLTVVPRFLMAPLMNLALKAQAKDVKGDDVSVRDLVLTMRYDAQAVSGSAGLVGRAGEVRARVLLLGGSKSAGYLKVALGALSAALPEAERVELAGLGHLAAEDQALVVAGALRGFFGAYSAKDEAAVLGVPPAQIGKTLVLHTTDGYVRAVIPGTRRLDLSRVRKVLADKHARLATEAELAAAYPMFALGAVPPLGGPSGDRVLVDQRIVEHDTIVVEAGTHDESVRLHPSGLLSLTHASVADICRR